VTVHTARIADLSAPTLHDLLRLRVDVFVVEQACPYPEVDGRDVDPSTLHVWTADADGRPTAYLRVLEEPDGSARIGRVCTRVDRRGEGLAAELLRATLERMGERRCVLDAQAHLATWYARLGFEVSGPEFVEDGIPHVPMQRPGHTTESTLDGSPRDA